VRWSLLREEGGTGWLVRVRMGVALVKAGFSEELGDALRCLVHLDGMNFFGVYAAVSYRATWGTGEGAWPTGSCTGSAVDLAHAKGPAVKHG
jgi:hypothetical protein